MIIGFDLDGVIAPNSPADLPFVRFALESLSKRPLPSAVQTLRQMARQNHRIIIVTARPRWVLLPTHAWLFLNRVPYHALYVVGQWRNKLHILKNVGVHVYFDDRQKNIDYLSQNGVNARLFEGWSHIVKGLKDGDFCFI